MKYESIQCVDKPLSRLVFGCAFGAMLGGEDVDWLLDAALERGINTFDTAETYGKSEVSLGNWIRKRKNRDQLVLITKGAHPKDGEIRVNPEAIREDIEKSFCQLGTDYIDIYLLHRDDPRVETGPLVEVLNEYHRAGKIGAFGGSNWTHQRIQEANDYARKKGLQPFSVSSPNFGLCEQKEDPWGGGCVSIAGPNERKAREFYVREKIPVFAYSSLGRGMLSGRIKSDDPEGARKILDPFAQKGYLYDDNMKRLARAEELSQKKGCSVPQLAIAYTLCQPFLVFPLISTSRISSMDANLKALDIDLTPSEIAWLEEG